MNYDAQAKQIANQLRADAVGPRRGVRRLNEPGVCAVFATDNYRLDPRTRDEVRLLLCDAYEEQVDVLGFAVDDVDGSCWALVAACDEPAWLRSRLKRAFIRAHGLDAVRS